MVDRLILSVSLISFILFLVIQIVIFRSVSHRKVMKWFFVTYLFVAILIGILGMFSNVWGNLLNTFLIWISYTLLVCIYLLGVFGILESSIRMRLLAEISEFGTSGLGYEKILIRYNVQTIIQKRLDRFIASGDVVEFKGKYYSKSKITLFLFPALVLIFLWKLYGKSNLYYVTNKKK